MANYVIVGAGPAGLYVGYRLLKSNTLKPGDTVSLYEWSERPGGRIYTFNFENTPWSDQGLYVEVGGMRFSVDKNWPNLPATGCEGHVLVQSMILELGLESIVKPFGESSNRLYYLRGKNFYEKDLTKETVRSLPYGFSQQFLDFVSTLPDSADVTADSILGQIAAVFAPNLGATNGDRNKWCSYYANGRVPEGEGSQAFPQGTPIRDMGYWNLLYDQLGDEGFDYSADGTGYTSNVINWNSADAMQANNDYGSSSPYMRLDGGYSQLFTAMAAEITDMGGGISYGQQLTGLEESADGTQTTCSFMNGQGNTSQVAADYLFLAMPRRALEMVAGGSPPNYMLNNPDVKLWLESSINQPAIKAVMVFDKAWWTGEACKFPPNLVWPGRSPKPPVQQWVGGATITDLPLRMIYYFANNIANGPGAEGGPYVVLASYDDMNYTSFWGEMESSGDYKIAPSLIRQPLTGPTPLNPNTPFSQILLKQLAEVHGMSVEDIPTPLAFYFQDWGQDPFGAGYHGWASHYNICQAMDCIRAPYEKILNNPTTKTYIVGSCYSFDQAWVEGAFCTAESVLTEFFGLPAGSPYSAGYKLICTTND